MNYSIGSFNFFRWQGTPPELARRQIVDFRKPGIAGLQSTAVGETGRPFTVQLSAVFRTRPLAESDERGYANLVGQLATVIYEGINYETARNHRYLVQSASTVALKATVRSFGPTYDYDGGWLVHTNWQLVPLRTV